MLTRDQKHCGGGISLLKHRDMSAQRRWRSTITIFIRHDMDLGVSNSHVDKSYGRGKSTICHSKITFVTVIQNDGQTRDGDSVKNDVAL